MCVCHHDTHISTERVNIVFPVVLIDIDFFFKIQRWLYALSNVLNYFWIFMFRESRVEKNTRKRRGNGNGDDGRRRRRLQWQKLALIYWYWLSLYAPSTPIRQHMLWERCSRARSLLLATKHSLRPLPVSDAFLLCDQKRKLVSF